MGPRITIEAPFGDNGIDNNSDNGIDNSIDNGIDNNGDNGVWDNGVDNGLGDSWDDNYDNYDNINDNGWDLGQKREEVELLQRERLPQYLDCLNGNPGALTRLTERLFIMQDMNLKTSTLMVFNWLLS